MRHGSGSLRMARDGRVATTGACLFVSVVLLQALQDFGMTIDVNALQARDLHHASHAKPKSLSHACPALALVTGLSLPHAAGPYGGAPG